MILIKRLRAGAEVRFRKLGMGAMYSEGIVPGDVEVYRIVCQKAGETNISLIDVDLSGGDAVGYLPPGDYDVRQIYYLGSNKSIIGQPVSLLRTLYSVIGEPRGFSLGIGEERVQSMGRRYGENMVFKEETVEYPSEDMTGVNIFYIQ